MAAFTLKCPVGSQERKTVRVIICALRYLLPAPFAVALFAVAAELTAVYVGMAVGTLGANAGKNQLDVTLPAIQTGMHSLQGKAGGSVIEFGKCANRLETNRRMTPSTVHHERPMAVMAPRTIDGERPVEIWR
jgi:hypothetical protein